MAFETVVGEQTAHVWMAGEHHAVKIVHLALEPVGARKHAGERGDRGRVVDLDLDANALVLSRRQQVVDDVEAPLAPRPVHRRHVNEAGKRAPWSSRRKVATLT